MVVAYGRPFTKSTGLPRLPGRFIRSLSAHEPQREHEVVMSDRHQVVAHSDGNAWEMRPHYRIFGSRKMLIPLHNGVRRPLLREPVEWVRDLACRHMDECHRMRDELEAVLSPHLLVDSGSENECDD